MNSKHKKSLISLALIALALLIGTASAVTVMAHFSQSSEASSIDPGKLPHTKNNLFTAHSTGVKRNALAASVALPAYNNQGICLDPSGNNTTSNSTGNFDGGGSCYSENYLAAVGFYYNDTFSYRGFHFTWAANSADGQADNYVPNGQVLPVTPVKGATNVALVGASNNGPSTGTATLTYTDSSTESFPFTLSDWTLNGNTAQPTFGEQIVGAMMYRDHNHGATENIKTYLFMVHTNLQAGKTLQSVTLPTSVNTGAMHIFAVGTGDTQIDPTYNNSGFSATADPTAANFDGGGWSYNFEDYQYYTPWDGYNYSYEGMSLYRPDLVAGQPDNTVAQGQTIAVKTVPGATTLGLVGSASNGPSFGTATINYTDGSQSTFTLNFSDWTLNGLSQRPSFGNRVLAFYPHRNYKNGIENTWTFLFYQEVDIKSDKTVASITLPFSANQGKLHVFAVGERAQAVYNSVGAVSDRSGPLLTNFDGGGNSLSSDALRQAGIPYPTPDNTGRTPATYSYTNSGVTFTLANSYGYLPDNFVAHGQTIAFQPPANSTRVAFLGTATDGASSGLASFNYTDGTSLQYLVGFNDWCDATTLEFGDRIAAQMSYRLTQQGKQTINTYLYYTEIGLEPGKTLQSITLPNPYSAAGTMHIFGIGGGGFFNNTSISSDSTPKSANFDTGGYSYSSQALANAGLSAGQTKTINGYNFTWPNADVLDDHIVQEGTYEDIVPAANTTSVAFLGSASNGASSQSISFYYQDINTGQKEWVQTQLSFPDWCSATGLTDNQQIAATMSYRNGPNGPQTINNYIYFTQFTAPAGKVILRVTFPDAPQRYPSTAKQGHIFAYSTK